MLVPTIRAHTQEHYGPVVIPVLLLAIYLMVKILPKHLNQKAYFRLENHFKLSKNQVNIVAQGLVGLSLVAGVGYFAIYVCWPLFF